MTFEQMIDKLSKSSPYDLISDFSSLVLGLANLRDRFQNMEKSRVKDLSRMQELEALTADEKATLESLAKDRDDLQKRLAALEQKYDAYVAKQAQPDVPDHPDAPKKIVTPSSIFVSAPTPVVSSPPS